MVVICHFTTKYAHFLSLKHPFIASTVAQQFLDTIFKLYGMPSSIVSDRDKLFTSLFWRELFKRLGTKLSYATAYHLQSDGQLERLNQCLEGYLSFLAYHQPHSWGKWLALAEYWYNTSYHEALRMTPFEALYGYKPSSLAILPAEEGIV